LKVEKDALRREMRARLAALGAGEFLQAGHRAAEKLAATDTWQETATVLLFLSMPQEIDTGALLRRALHEGRRVYAPRVEGDSAQGAMWFYRLRSAEGPFAAGAYGIREPVQGAEALQVGPAAGRLLVVTPGLAFDLQGGRLGHGAGFYDRFFARLKAAGQPFSAVGFCLDCQIVPGVPQSAHDLRMDSLISG
jgi:5-formyltetrahydrofolate cyclo-ligase